MSQQPSSHTGSKSHTPEGFDPAGRQNDSAAANSGENGWDGGADPSKSTTPPPRPSKLRLAAITLLGPPIGTIALFLAQATFDPPPVPQASDLFPIAVFLLTFGYMLGLLPAALAALGYAGAYSRATTRLRQLALCVLIGALTGALGVLPPLWTFDNAITFEPHFMALSALAGSIALPATAMPFSRLPA